MSAKPKREDLDEIFLTTEELALRWRQRVETLQNQRSAGTGLPFIKLPTGPILYRASDVIDAELNGMKGLTLDRVSKLIAECPLLDTTKARAVSRWVADQCRRK